MTNDNPTAPDHQPAGACQVQRPVRPADEVQPLVERLEEGGCGAYCDSLGREASAALQSLQESYGQLLAENVRLRAELAARGPRWADGGAAMADALGGHQRPEKEYR